MSKFRKTSNINKKSNNHNTENLITGNRDFNQRSTNNNQAYKKYNNQPKYRKTWFITLVNSAFNRLLNLSIKIRYFTAIAIISITLFWMFSGKHNSTSITQEIDLGLISKDSKSESAQVFTEPKPEPEIVITPVERNIIPDKNITQDEQVKLITKIIRIQKNDNISSIFEKYKIHPDDLNQIITDKKINEQLKKFNLVKNLKLVIMNDQKNLKKLSII